MELLSFGHPFPFTLGKAYTSATLRFVVNLINGSASSSLFLFAIQHHALQTISLMPCLLSTNALFWRDTAGKVDEESGTLHPNRGRCDLRMAGRKRVASKGVLEALVLDVHHRAETCRNAKVDKQPVVS